VSERPVDPDYRMVLRTVYLRPEVDERLRVHAFRQKTTKNDMIAKAVEEYLERNGAATWASEAKPKRAPRKRSEKSK